MRSSNPNQFITAVREATRLYESYLQREPSSREAIELLDSSIQTMREAKKTGDLGGIEKTYVSAIIKPLKRELHGLEGVLEDEVYDTNGSLREEFHEQSMQLRVPFHDDATWQQLEAIAKDYALFVHSALKNSGKEHLADEAVLSFPPIAKIKGDLDASLDAAEREYRAHALRGARDADAKIGEFKELQEGYRKLGFTRKLFPVPRKDERFSFARQYQAIESLINDATSVKKNFTETHRAREKLELEVAHMQRMKSKAAPLADTRYDPNAFRALEPLIYTRSLTDTYSELCSALNPLIDAKLAEDKLMRYSAATRNAPLAYAPIGLADEEKRNSHTTQRTAPPAASPQYATIGPHIEPTSEPAEGPAYINDALFSPPLPKQRFDFFSHMTFLKSPSGSRVAFEVRQALMNPNTWETRMELLDEALREAGTPTPAERSYLGAVREGLIENLKTGPLHDLCSRLVSARAPVRMAMQTLDSYLQPQPTYAG